MFCKNSSTVLPIYFSFFALCLKVKVVDTVMGKITTLTSSLSNGICVEDIEHNEVILSDGLSSICEFQI